MIIRPANIRDLDGLLQQARDVGPGMTTLPGDRRVIAEKIAASISSFEQRVEGDSSSFLFVCEEPDSGSILGCSALYTNVGAEYGFYSYKLSSSVQRSTRPTISRTLRYLLPVNDLTGWSEVGTLIVRPTLRKSGIGRKLAQSRYLLAAQFPDITGSRLFAELRGWQSAEGSSPFWDAVGQPFFDLDFASADRMSAVDGSRFIYELLPRVPICVDLIDAEAAASIGRAHDTSQHALHMLLQEGFRYEGYVDVFDAGPQVFASTNDISTVRNSAVCPVLAADPEESRGIDALICSTELCKFSVSWGRVELQSDGVSLPQAVKRTLNLVAGDLVRVSSPQLNQAIRSASMLEQLT